MSGPTPEQVAELIDGLRRRAAACDTLAGNYPPESLDRERCRGKASGYAHAATLLGNVVRGGRS